MFKSCDNEGGGNAENMMTMVLLKTQEKLVLCPHLRFCDWFQLLHQKDIGEGERFRGKMRMRCLWRKYMKSLKCLGLFKER